MYTTYMCLIHYTIGICTIITIEYMPHLKISSALITRCKIIYFVDINLDYLYSISIFISPTAFYVHIYFLANSYYESLFIITARGE